MKKKNKIIIAIIIALILLIPLVAFAAKVLGKIIFL